jgi:hypothetical protein
VDVSLVLRGEGGKWAERPISDFIIRSRPKSADPEPKLPTLTFLFAGSVLHGDGPGPRRYLSDDSGNVISLSTFGDELLCLPAIHSQANDALQWQVARNVCRQRKLHRPTIPPPETVTHEG